MASAPLPEKTRRWLLEQARATIATAVGHGEPLSDAPALPDGADEPRGCFVTLHTRSGALRGCIGTFVADEPLWRAVREMAVAAATRDPRFRALSGDELDDCVLEISALTPTEPAQPEDVEVGRHGVCVERGYNRGVLLPQVATEHGWDRETFISQTCVKAGLPPDAWRDGSVTLEVFSAEVFGESDG
jgi:AmmeMemoRadiSam system protein A